MKIVFKKLVRSSYGAAPLAAICLLAACSDQAPIANGQSGGEVQRLRAENEEVAKLRRENQELPRLRKDNEEVQKLRDVPQHLAMLRKENEELRQAGRKPGQALPARQIDPITGHPLPSTAAIPGQPTAQETNEAAPSDPNLPREGDEILIEPKLLGRLLPGFDWEKLERKEPIAIKSLLDQQGIILTNYQQLLSYGITNYVIQRNPPKPEGQPAPQ